MNEELETIKIDFYLKLTNEAAMTTILSDFYKQDTETTVDEETGEETTTNVGDPYLVSNTSNYAIDIVGTLSEPTGNTLTDDNDMEYPEMQDLDGWHVNICLIGDEVREAVEALNETHGVTPSTPKRIWL
tara:strand:+ start:869 stop:1258 length:390 start_codon:yes stop_codon:yes gene_type:complete